MNATSPILTLPNEILAKIFGDNDLCDVDISRAIQVCKLFKENIQGFVGQKLTFIVDTASHLGWRFVRCLLRTPEIGEHFIDITIEWDRRNWKRWRYDRKPWTADWVWTELEKQQIVALCHQWEINENTKSLILGGKNSEALLPLILCFTPNLKALDLGEVDISLVDFGTPAPGGDMFLSVLELLGHDFDDDFNNVNDYNKFRTAYYNFVASYRPPNHSLFFFDNLQYKVGGNIVGPKKVFPGLASLEIFRIGGPKDDRTVHGISLRHSECFAILLLPRIQSVAMSSTFASVDLLEPFSDRPSTLKRLTFIHGFTHQQEPDRVVFFEKLSEITSNLEQVYINARFSSFEQDHSRFFEPITRIFLKNIKTLKSSNILVNGGGFDETGRWNFDEERRREVARKQKAFELIRWKLQTLKPPPIVTTSKIIPEVLKHLHRSDVFSLMLSCKALYDICYPDMWANFRFGSHFDWKRFRASVGSAGASRRLAKSIELFGAGGFEHLERLEFTQHFYTVNSHKESPKEILYMLANQIGLGNTPKLSHLSLDWPRVVERIHFRVEAQFHDPDSLRFYHTIKEYSQKRTPEEFSLRLVFSLASLPRVNPSSLLDLQKLRDLEVIVKWDYNLDVAIMAANTLVDILFESPNLEKVKLRGGGSLNDYIRSAIYAIKRGLGRLWEAMAGLQTAIGNLKHLRSLSIVDALSIHPSFLLTPPPSCRSISYSGKTTTSWWEQFANFSFSGIERMTLTCTDIRASEGRVIKQMTGEDLTPVGKLTLGDVKISTLKSLTISPPSGGLGTEIEFKGYPSDFVDCMLKKNPQLSDECLKPLAGRIAGSYTRDRNKVITKVLNKHVGALQSSLSAALTKYAEDIAFKTLRETRSIGEEFQSEMREKPIDILIQQFERELGPRLVAECTELLQSQLREAPSISRPHPSDESEESEESDESDESDESEDEDY
ncbi:hypothetical protein TWF506_010669 [Arthrobotrys conoides]|uniref:F-box domain-containing protein n=1 Tax=Arthrobotrys conoides TaxID=74498 RepID=A0AAN8N970_9PEZI